MNNAQNNIDGKFVNAGNGIFGEVLSVWNDGGDLMWNFGQMSDVVSIDRETAKSIWITEKCDRTGNLFSRRFAKTRLVAAF